MAFQCLLPCFKVKVKGQGQMSRSKVKVKCLAHSVRYLGSACRVQQKHYDTWNTVQDLCVFVSNQETSAIKSCAQRSRAFIKTKHIKIKDDYFAFQGEDEEFDEEIEKVTGKDGEDAPTPRSLKSESNSLIHPNDVLKALRAFVEENKQPTK